MPLITEKEELSLVQQIRNQLEQTPYACSTLTRLNGGTANFTYRGTLLQPLKKTARDTSVPVETIVIKLSTEFVAINRDFPLDITRCIFEESMLNALESFYRAHPISGGTVVRTPESYFFNPDTHIQAIEDLTDTTDLAAVLKSSYVDKILPGSGPKSVGQALGSWLRSFHMWASEPAQASLVAQVGPNPGMRRLKCLITYDSFIEILERHPEVIEGYKSTLEDVKVVMKYEFERAVTEGDDSRGLIHGDFWTGNVLVPNVPWREVQQGAHEQNRLFIIDWENIQFGHRAVDLGGILADLIERNHFSGVAASIRIMGGVMEGYGPISEEMAFRVAIHAGVHLICWYYRRDRTAPLPFPLPQVLAALNMGRDFILKGWAKDKAWFESTVLAPLFAD